jgi:hypothetical protein
MPDYDIYGVAIIPVILALVSFAKMMGMPPKFSPVLALVLGIVAAIVYISPGDWRKATFDGIMIGLSASGLYSGAKYMALNGKSKSGGTGATGTTDTTAPNETPTDTAPK